MNMNKNQKIVLIVGVIIMVIVFLFAPVYVPYEGGYIRVEDTNEAGRKLPSDVLIREGLVAVVTIAIYFALKDKKG